MTKNLELKVVENSIKLGRPRDNSRDEVIIEATLRQLTLYGYEALSTTEIAKEARVSKATIYNSIAKIFNSKMYNLDNIDDTFYSIFNIIVCN